MHLDLPDSILHAEEVIIVVVFGRFFEFIYLILRPVVIYR